MQDVLIRDARHRSLLARAEAVAMTDDDVAEMGRAFAVTGAVSREEASALFLIEASAAPKPAAWRPFFVETVTAHLVWEMRPTGVVNEAQSEWLLAEADRAATLGALAVLVNVMAEAHRVPLWFLAAVRARAARGWTEAEAAIAEAEAEARALVA